MILYTASSKIKALKTPCAGDVVSGEFRHERKGEFSYCIVVEKDISDLTSNIGALTMFSM